MAPPFVPCKTCARHISPLSNGCRHCQAFRVRTEKELTTKIMSAIQTRLLQVPTPLTADAYWQTACTARRSELEDVLRWLYDLKRGLSGTHTVASWNLLYPIGTHVLYRPNGRSVSHQVEGVTCSEAQKVNDDDVVFIKGVLCGVPLSRVEACSNEGDER